MKDQNKFYYLAVDPNNDQADLYIFGDITSLPWYDSDKSAHDVVNDLKAVTASNITVHINSYGGEVAEGLAIYNTLKNWTGQVTTICDGFACSAASVVFMAGSERIMNAASLLMIHNAWTFTYGNAVELRKTADDLDTITQASINAYKSVAKIPEETIKELMDSDTWILPEDALEYGFATTILEDDPDEQTPQQSAFRSLVKRLAEPETVRESGLDYSEMLDEINRKLDKIEQKLKQKEDKTIEKTPLKGWAEFFGKGTEK